MKGREKIWRGLGILIIIVCLAIILKIKLGKDENETQELTKIYIATGEGKESFLEDKDVTDILKNRYGLNVTYDKWNNEKLVKDALVRKDGSGYDAMFTSDQRFYDYYKLAANTDKGEAERNTVYKGGLTLNTPIVIYSWDTITDALITEEIVVEIDGVYYITDMNKLIEYILTEKKWSDIGINTSEKNVNITSTNPTTSSLGANYYELLLSVMCGGSVTEELSEQNLPRLKEFYTKSGYVNSTEEELFEQYLKAGDSKQPMIIGYEKKIIDYANANKEEWEKLKDKVRILYPTPTIWSSHCIATFTENGDEYYEVYNDGDIQQIAWSRYGFRTGVTVGSYDVSSVNINGISKTIDSTVTGLQMDMYEKLINYLKN